MVWWERYPGELEREIHALEIAGMQPRKNEERFAAGKAEIKIRLEVLGAPRDGFVVYPDLYPYFRPTLHVPGLGSGLRHYNPIMSEICLLKRGTQHWMPEMTAAAHIMDMLPHWEQAAVQHYGQPRLETEDSQAEPATEYYPAVLNQHVVMDGSWQLPVGVKGGRLKIAMPGGYRSILPFETFTAWAIGFEDSNKKHIEGLCFSEPVHRWVQSQNYESCSYPWIRLESPPLVRAGEELVRVLISSDPKVKSHVDREIDAGRCGLYGFCFPEEDPSGGYRDGWLFLAYHCDHKAKRKKGAGPGVSAWILKPDYAGERDLFERIPELNPLRCKSVAIIGLGCVGAPSALALARAGVGELRLLDGDSISAGTTCRWPLGFTAIGAGKVMELTRYISQNYPFTRIGTGHYPYGNKKDCMVTIGVPSGDYDQWDCLMRLIEGVDLIYDATAEQGVNLLLNDLAISRQIPYISVASRTGGWGGNVVRVKPGSEGGCYRCYLHALKDGKIAHPPYDHSGDGLQPVGCGGITFKAAGFDVEEIALAGIRMAVSSLCEGSQGAYPSILHDVGILSLRKKGFATFPEWQNSHIPQYSECGICNR